jgi:tyrosyl-tRNA synthetase
MTHDLLRGIREVSPDFIDLNLDINLHQFLSQPRRIKLGFDPTSDFLHLGHSILLRKLGALQQMGHIPVIIIGDFTARIGDPTGKNSTRPQLDAESVAANGQAFLSTLGNFLDLTKCEIVYNSSHLSSLALSDIVKLQSLMTVQQMLAKRDFSNRLACQSPICLHEFLYPLLQGYDSFAVRSEVELGGIDQKFNVLVGRDIQKGLGSSVQQIGVFMPILVGTDGHEKMSKSLGNAIAINEHPFSMYSKLEKIPDVAVDEYLVLLTDCHLSDFSENPRERQKQMALEVTSVFHSRDKALEAQQSANSIILSPDPESQSLDLPEISINNVNFPTPLVSLLKELKLVKSTSEARRMVRGGSVFLSGIKVTDEAMVVPSMETLNKQIIRLSKKEIYKFTLQ